MFSLISILYSVFNEHFLNLNFFKFLKHLNFFKCFKNLKILLDWVDSNHRPHAYQACALTTWATIQYLRVLTSFVPYGWMEMMGFEPMTPCLQGRCSPNWATPPYFRSSRLLSWKIPQNWTMKQRLPSLNSYWRLTSCVCQCRFSIERRWSSRTFRYGYLVTT